MIIIMIKSLWRIIDNHINNKILGGRNVKKDFEVY